MKTPEQWMDKWITTHGMSFEKMIAMAQKEAYNQALDDACNNAVAYNTVPSVYTSCTVDKQSILKLKR